ncbi:MAG: UDP-N-acetylmuramate--L-alanine ligase [Phycisphaerales bacterium JB063]
MTPNAPGTDADRPAVTITPAGKTPAAPRTGWAAVLADPAVPLDLAGKRLHFVGIGGCGMSGLARMAAKQGAICTGSDIGMSKTVGQLRAAGIAVSLNQDGSAIAGGPGIDLLVISAAIREQHPEVLEAVRQGAAVMKYAQLLGRLMVGRVGVAIAGTHGKSTTTSILSHVLIQSGLDPSFIVGANCEQIGGGWRVSEKRGMDETLVAEACEYDRSFHNFSPTHATVLNVEADHLDLYSSIDEIVEAFRVFAQRVPADGSLLVHHESPHRLAVTAGLSCDVETIGFAPQADWRVEVLADGGWEADGGPQRARVKLWRGNESVAQWASPMPGDHFAYNAAVAAVTAHRLGAKWGPIAQAISSFRGLDRRMQLVGRRTLPTALADKAQRPLPVTVVDDYGHHPTEVDTTLRALAAHYRPNRLVCVFQPHQHSRTRHLMDQFVVSFGAADIVIVPEIYFVRDSEQEKHAVTAGDLVDRLRKQGVTAMHLHPFDAIIEQLELITQPGDLVVTMGAGDVWQIGHAFVEGGN